MAQLLIATFRKPPLDSVPNFIALQLVLNMQFVMVTSSLPCRRIKATYRSLTHPNIIVLDKERGGKEDALNAGLNASRYPLFCSIDGDCEVSEECCQGLCVLRGQCGSTNNGEQRVAGTTSVDT